jgi:hypothetical protein
MYGPLRLLYELPTRRRKKRPKTLPLKVKRTAKDQWSYIEVEQEKYPFLILFPYFSMPEILSKGVDLACKGAATDRFWIRGASPSYIFKDLLEQLVHELGVYSIKPEGKAQVSECCQMLAKIGHAFAVAELGIDSFHPFLIPHIIRSELSDCDKFIGGRGEDEVVSSELHELSLVGGPDHEFVVVRIRLLARLGTPTYFLVVGATGQQVC